MRYCLERVGVHFLQLHVTSTPTGQLVPVTRQPPRGRDGGLAVEGKGVRGNALSQAPNPAVSLR